jgi:hypothetical protein
LRIDAKVLANFTVRDVELEFVGDTKPTVYLECRARCGNCFVKRIRLSCRRTQSIRLSEPAELCCSSLHSVELNQNSKKWVTSDPLWWQGGSLANLRLPLVWLSRREASNN